VVERYLGANGDSRQKYQKVAGKLGLIQAILDAKAMKANQTCELQCLGIVGRRVCSAMEDGVGHG
jgi:hypothetical protein